MTTSLELQGAATLARALLCGATRLPALPPDIVSVVNPAWDTLPPQWYSVGHTDHAARWIDLAALVEADGQWDAAWDLLAAMTETLSADFGAERRNLLAFLCARRGRVARMAGRLETAEACYAQALAEADRHTEGYWADVYPAAWLGRSVLAVERGNYPEAKRCAQAAIRPHVPTAHHAQAYQMLALIARKAGDVSGALHALWRAHDCRDGHPVHQAAILVSLAEVAAEAGEPCAAIRAWVAILTNAGVPRFVAPCLIGLLGAFAHHLSHTDPCGACAECIAQSPWADIDVDTTHPSLVTAARALDRTAQRVLAHEHIIGIGVPPLPPHDQVELLLMRSRLLRALGATTEAADTASQAEAEATRFGFHERTFQSADLVRLPARERHAEGGRPPAAVRRFFTMSNTRVGATAPLV